MNFIWKNFNELSVYQLYECMKLRTEVFVVEQDCVYQDFDDYDQNSLHLICQTESQILSDSESGDKPVIVAYLRVLPPNIKYENAVSIGRVITKITHRGTGLGYQIMKEGIARCKELYPNFPIKISAQYHLQNFYSKLGFKVNSAPYYEDGIAHIEMLIE